MTGADLKALREEFDLSRAKASRQVEVSERTWARWEAGKQNIPAGVMKRFRLLNAPDRVEQ